MSALPLLLAMTLASPGGSLHVPPPPDPGPFGGAELAASSVGTVVGDALVIGAGYGALQLFANGTFRPTAANFRTAALAIGVTAIVVPPLTAALLGRLAQAEPASGAFWKALLLATAGQAIALGAGVAAYPRLWVILPVQLVTLSLGTTLGLHWGSRGDAEARLDGPRDEPAPAAPAPAEARAVPYCPDPALAAR
jgi:hypothetical protein